MIRKLGDCSLREAVRAANTDTGEPTPAGRSCPMISGAIAFAREDGCIRITVKTVDDGVVSPFLAQRAEPGTIVTLSDVEGEYVLPDPLPAKLFFISAGSGVTPIMSMFRQLEREDALDDVVHVHSDRIADDVIFGSQLRDMAERHPGFRLHEQHTGALGRMGPACGRG